MTIRTPRNTGHARATWVALLLASLTAAAIADDLIPLPAPKQSGDVTYVSGGIPDEQMPAVREARGRYPLVVEIYEKLGSKNQYTADAQVKLVDAKGRVVLDDTSDGPFFLVKPAPGTYRVQATYNGKTLEQRNVTVGTTGSKRVVFVFPAS